MVLKCILYPHLYFFIKKEACAWYSLTIGNHLLYYLSVHLRLSSVFYSHHLVDIFSYEIPNTDSRGFLAVNSNLLVYNYNCYANQDRILVHCYGHGGSDVSSLSELFSSSNWLERENCEMHGVYFSGKKDLRNLLLQYGDSSRPFQKIFPTIGLKEMYFNPIKDTLVQSTVSNQV